MSKKKNKWYVSQSRLFSAGIFVGLLAYLIPKEKISETVNSYIIAGLLGLLCFALYKFYKCWKAVKDEKDSKSDWRGLIQNG